MSDRELEMQEDDNLVTEEEVTLEIAGYRAVDDSELEEARSRKVKESDIDDDDTAVSYTHLTLPTSDLV